MTIKEMLAQLDALDQEYARLTALANEAKVKRDRFEHEVHEAMGDAGYEPGDDTSFGGTRWGRQVDWYAKIQDPIAFIKWAEANAPHLIQPRPQKSALNQLVQQAHEDGTPLPPGLGAHPKEWISRRAR